MIFGSDFTVGNSKRSFVAAMVTVPFVKLSVYPLSTITTRMQYGLQLNMRMLYKGVLTDVILNTPSSGIYFATYEVCKANHINAPLSGVVSQVVCSPFSAPIDILKYRQQLDLRVRITPSLIMNGFKYKLLASCAFSSMYLPLFDYLKHKQDCSRWISSLTASMISTLVTLPLDRLKLLRQLGRRDSIYSLQSYNGGSARTIYSIVQTTMQLAAFSYVRDFFDPSSSICTLGPERNKWFLVLSNLAYLLPSGVTAYKMFKPQGRQMNKQDGAELLSLFIFVTFFSSWSYHMCRSDLSIQSGSDVCELIPSSSKIDGCLKCKTTSLTWAESAPGSSVDTTFGMAHFVDHFFAMFTLLMVMIHVVPINEKIRKLIMVISIIWMIVFLSVGNDAFAGIPVVIASILTLMFWFVLRNQKSKNFVSRNKLWSLAAISTVLAFVFFKWDNEPYWIKHSLWHIMGAVAGAFLLSAGAGCYEDIDTSSLIIPKWMQTIFITPNECKQYDDAVNHKCG